MEWMAMLALGVIVAYGSWLFFMRGMAADKSAELFACIEYEIPEGFQVVHQTKEEAFFKRDPEQQGGVTLSIAAQVLPGRDQKRIEDALKSYLDGYFEAFDIDPNRIEREKEASIAASGLTWQILEGISPEPETLVRIHYLLQFNCYIGVILIAETENRADGLEGVNQLLRGLHWKEELGAEA